MERTLRSRSGLGGRWVRRASVAVGLWLVVPGEVVGLGPSIGAQAAPSLGADLAADVRGLRTKYVGLAKAMPAEKFDWRPGAGVRSVAELFKHVISDNYLLPAIAGAVPPEATGIKGTDYNTAVAYEKRQMSKDEIVVALEQSFTFVADALAATPDARMGESVSMFGQPASTQKLWLLTMTHLHEHLGQSIAYARSNGVVPPWSK